MCMADDAGDESCLRCEEFILLRLRLLRRERNSYKPQYRKSFAGDDILFLRILFCYREVEKQVRVIIYRVE